MHSVADTTIASTSPDTFIRKYFFFCGEKYDKPKSCSGKFTRIKVTQFVIHWFLIEIDFWGESRHWICSCQRTLQIIWWVCLPDFSRWASRSDRCRRTWEVGLATKVPPIRYRWWSQCFEAKGLPAGNIRRFGCLGKQCWHADCLQRRRFARIIRRERTLRCANQFLQYVPHVRHPFPDFETSRKSC